MGRTFRNEKNTICECDVINKSCTGWTTSYCLKREMDTRKCYKLLQNEILPEIL